MEKFPIDINCDLGEGFGNDQLLMPWISSCSIACGGHAGNDQSMAETLALAKKHKVRAGAHPSFPDTKNFGRKWVDIGFKDLVESLVGQTERLVKIASEKQINLHHLKPHGALYNKAAVDPEAASAVIETVQRINPGLILYAPYGSVLSKLAIEAGLRVYREAFLDRSYNADLTLVGRESPHALVTDVSAIARQVRSMVIDRKVQTVEEEWREIGVDTLCIHGDNPEAPAILEALHKLLNEVNIQIR